jgi:exosortase C (VPDSG-CTERM-specific)
VVLTVAFARPLFSLAAYAAGSDLDSYILLIPFISAYLLYLQRKGIAPAYQSSTALACIPAAVSVTALAMNWQWRQSLSQNDSLSLVTLAFVFFIAVGVLLFLGRKWIAGSAFPIGFLIFMVPLPDAAVTSLETASKLASVEAAALFFEAAGVPALRDGPVFQLPDIAIRVAQECSGIHSSWILIIASLLASHLILRTSSRRAVLIAFAILLGVIRNGFRILVLGWLCIHFGPQMIDTPIHHKGGPVFFVLSLIPFFLLLWALCRGDRKALSRRRSRDALASRLSASGLQPE